MIGVDEARYVKDYTVWLWVSDGLTGEVDLRSELYGEVFEPLKDPAVFLSFAVQPEWRTIAWPNGADLAPEFLYAAVEAELARGCTPTTAPDPALCSERSRAVSAVGEPRALRGDRADTDENVASVRRRIATMVRDLT